MTKSPSIQFDLVEDAADDTHVLNLCLTNDQSGGDSEETILTLDTESNGGTPMQVTINGEEVEAGKVEIQIRGSWEFAALMQGMEEFLKYYHLRQGVEDFLKHYQIKSGPTEHGDKDAY